MTDDHMEPELKRKFPPYLQSFRLSPGLLRAIDDLNRSAAMQLARSPGFQAQLNTAVQAATAALKASGVQRRVVEMMLRHIGPMDAAIHQSNGEAKPLVDLFEEAAAAQLAVMQLAAATIEDEDEGPSQAKSVKPEDDRSLIERIPFSAKYACAVLFFMMMVLLQLTNDRPQDIASVDAAQVQHVLDLYRDTIATALALFLIANAGKRGKK